ncbi:MAG: methylated-DNA--[protein]-cysteine S-methyltransferase [Proteobacteria bacterium]|nr:methylated-DNA--[protein]-cysteine S-methyltransferase [Pseudomonadota bacterium]
MKYSYRPLLTPFGQVHMIAHEKAVLAVAWDNTIAEYKARWSPELRLGPQSILDELTEEIQAYMQGNLYTFKVAWELQIGTSFQQKVWQSLLDIPFGETLSYGMLAQTLSHPNAARAIGAANAKNPLSLLLPCHRVIGKSGKLVGYAGGLKLKQDLLELERTHIDKMIMSPRHINPCPIHSCP